MNKSSPALRDQKSCCKKTEVNYFDAKESFLWGSSGKPE